MVQDQQLCTIGLRIRLTSRNLLAPLPSISLSKRFLRSASDSTGLPRALRAPDREVLLLLPELGPGESRDARMKRDRPAELLWLVEIVGVGAGAPGAGACKNDGTLPAALLKTEDTLCEGVEAAPALQFWLVEAGVGGVAFGVVLLLLPGLLKTTLLLPALGGRGVVVMGAAPFLRVSSRGGASAEGGPDMRMPLVFDALSE